MFSMESSAPESPSSTTCILLLMLTYVVPDFFPRISISSVVSLWVFFIVSTYIFWSWMVLFNLITCLVVFSCNSLRDFCVSSLRSSTCVAVFSCNSLRDFFAPFLKGSTCLAVFSCNSLSELLMPFLKSSRPSWDILDLNLDLWVCLGIQDSLCGDHSGFWWCWMVLGSVSMILGFAFCHLVISGVRCSSCLWLDLISPVILGASVSTAGSSALSWVPVVRELSACKLSSCREGPQRSGAQIHFLAEDESPKGLCSRSSFTSVAQCLCKVICLLWNFWLWIHCTLIIATHSITCFSLCALLYLTWLYVIL
jgi:hypothetical protein